MIGKLYKCRKGFIQPRSAPCLQSVQKRWVNAARFHGGNANVLKIMHNGTRNLLVFLILESGLWVNLHLMEGEQGRVNIHY